MSQGSAAQLLRRDTLVLRADPSRVIAKLFLPGQELVASGVSRAQAVLGRVVALSDAEVTSTLSAVRSSFGARHRDLDGVFAEHFKLVAHQLPNPEDLSADRRLLIGAYSTQEYAVEAAALFNPSMVASPDQTGVADGELRFVMSLRAVGEGHISCIEFRTGIIGPSGVRIDEPGSHLGAGYASESLVSREFVRDALALDGVTVQADRLLNLLRDHFSANHVDEAALALKHDKQAKGGRSRTVADRVRDIAAGHYRLSFSEDRAISERVIYPTSSGERQGLEDLRLTRFVENSGGVSYLGTYTAFDGARIAPRLLRTKDFRVFDMIPLVGPAAKDKGMALFPRAVGGDYYAIARWDRESLCLASSHDGYGWEKARVLQIPARPWELIQLGNCGAPIETPEGWLVLTHGVGAMRVYSISAVLL